MLFESGIDTPSISVCLIDKKKSPNSPRRVWQYRDLWPVGAEARKKYAQAQATAFLATRISGGTCRWGRDTVFVQSRLGGIQIRRRIVGERP